MSSSKMYYLLLVLGSLVAFCESQAIPDFCLLPPDDGEGPKFDYYVHYDAVNDQCSPMLYKGSGGNANRFSSEIECIRNCSSNAERIYPMDVTEACHFKKAEGQCSGHNLRYYYDSVHLKCKKFQWTGCVGNGNRFLTAEICNATCSGIHDEPDEDNPAEENPDDPDSPVAIILGVLLGITVVAIVITAIVLTVKSRKKSEAKKAAGKRREEKTEVPLREQSVEIS